MHSVLFICLGNICRSPAAEGIFRQLLLKNQRLDECHVESCAVGGWHVGSLPDKRMRQAALRRGIELNSRAQQLNLSFYHSFDFLLAADHSVLKAVKDDAPPNCSSQILLITAFSAQAPNAEVKDPYYGGKEGFEEVLDQLEEACLGLYKHIFRE